MNAAFLALSLFAAAPVDFDTDVLPVLAKAGCNAGACHGAAAGRGGFKLSLFGGDPAADYRAITRELEERRVNLAQPQRSLLLLKPTWQLDHEGGERFTADSPEADLLLEWIKAGAERAQIRVLSGIQVTPAQPTVDQLPTKVALKVTAGFEDGSSRDVTELAIYTAADPAATTIDERGGVEVLRPGRHAIVVRFLTHVQAVQVTAPFAQPPLALAASAKKGNNWIDDEINATLAALRLSPVAKADDATLLRRLTLDLTGRLPMPERVRAYLADPSPEKFAAELERLLASNEFNEYWTYKLALWLRLQLGPHSAEGTQAYQRWIWQQIASRRPLDAMAAELLISDGDTHASGPPNFHKSASDARGEAEHVAETLFGVRLKCANCHNHPLDRWTQDDYHGLAAIFARLERGQVVRVASSGEVLHPVSGEPARQRIPGERFLPPEGDGRGELSRWLVGKENPYFAKAWVNRLWKSLLGRGLVEPTDDLRESNPATHPQLLNQLARDFRESGFDIQHTLRLIATSATYQRSSQRQPGAVPDDRFYSSGLVRPLPPEVLLDAICDATGTEAWARKDDPPGNGKRAIHTSAPLSMSSVLGPLARCGGQASCTDAESSASFDELALQLQWMNGTLLNSRVAAERGPFERLSKSEVLSRIAIEDCYLQTLSRLPSDAEVAHWQAELIGRDREQKCQDFAWALLSSREFVTNH